MHTPCGTPQRSNVRHQSKALDWQWAAEESSRASKEMNKKTLTSSLPTKSKASLPHSSPSLATKVPLNKCEMTKYDAFNL